MGSLPEPYYEDGSCTIYHGDSREVLPELGPQSVDLVFTSPPYNLGVTSGGGFADVRKYPEMKMGKWSGGALAHGYGVYDDAMDPAEYEEWQKRTLLQCWRLLCPTGAIFYNHKPRVQDGVLWTPLALNPGLPVRQIVIWARAGGVNYAPTHYVPTHEWVVVFAKSAFRLRSKAASGAGDVWRIPQKADASHPAPFPVGLPMRAIETTPARVVLDPFMGSGTTLLAAKNLGRRAIGIELEERYCELAANRLAQGVLDFTAQKEPTGTEDGRMTIW